MSIWAYWSFRWLFVIGFRVGTPSRFEVIQVEVCIFLHIFQVINLQFLLRMCKWAIILVGTISNLLVRMAKLGSVFLWMIELFWSVVSIITVILIGAIHSFWHKGTQIWRIVSERPPLIVSVQMIVVTSLGIMILLNQARFGLECVEIQLFEGSLSLRWLYDSLSLWWGH